MDAPPILTGVGPGRLECTLHSSRHRCLLRLRSGRAGSGGKGGGHVLWAKPDLSTLCAVPITAGREGGAALDAADGGVEMRLLPNLYHAAHPSDNSGDNEAGSVEGEGNSLPKDHPCRGLVRIANGMEAQLKERLRDASDGAMQSDGNVSRDSDRTNADSPNWFGMQEEFLLRSEAVLQELLSAVGQQLRKEESNQRGTGGGSSGRKRNATERGAGSTLAPPPLTYYAALVQQLQVIQSMPNVTDISLHKDPATADDADGQEAGDLVTVSVTCIDEKKRSHTWHAELYPSIVLTVDLPAEFALDERHLRLDKWWESSNTQTNNGSNSSVLPQVHKQFMAALQKYQPLFDELDDLDAHLWILDPSLPARRNIVERRIALAEGGASLVLALDPENARGVPSMVRFLGVTMATMQAAAKKGDGDVVDWRASFAAFVSDDGEGKMDVSTENEQKQTRWSEQRSVRENLELWFGAPLPSPLAPSAEKSEFLVECGICYMHRLPMEDNDEEGPLPEAKCGNASCNRHYHETCLFEWLHSLPTARVSFDRIFGTCPYCCEAVSVKIMNAGN